MSTIIVEKIYIKKIFNFVDTNLNAKGELIYDSVTMVPETISGSIYEKADPKTGINGNQIGGFNGYYADGVLRYTVSDMTAKTVKDSTQLIEDIESNIQSIITSEITK